MRHRNRRRDARARVLQGRVPVDLPHLGRQRLVLAVEIVVQELGHFEEGLAPLHDVPGRIEADVAHERNQHGEELGHATALGGRVDVLHACSWQIGGELANLPQDLVADDRRVLLK